MLAEISDCIVVNWILEATGTPCQSTLVDGQMGKVDYRDTYGAFDELMTTKCGHREWALWQYLEGFHLYSSTCAPLADTSDVAEDCSKQTEQFYEADKQ